MLIRKVLDFIKSRSERAQSFVELAIVLPFLLLILLGLVEVVFFIARYMDVIDLTREAARVASVRAKYDEPFVPGSYTCASDSAFNFYWTTACVFAPPDDYPGADPSFKGGMNSLIYLDPKIDDVVVEVFSVKNATDVGVYPAAGYWAFSDNDSDTTHNENWKKDCHGNMLPPYPTLAPPAPANTPRPRTPNYTESSVAAQLESTGPQSKGFVGVEFYYCYQQVLNLPIYNWFVPNPLRIHAYSLMPLPAAAPIPTPTP